MDQTYLTSEGKKILLRDMNTHHLLGAIEKIKKRLAVVPYKKEVMVYRNQLQNTLEMLKKESNTRL